MYRSRLFHLHLNTSKIHAVDYNSATVAIRTTAGRCRFWHGTQDCVVPDIDSNLYRWRFSATSTASWTVRL